MREKGGIAMLRIEAPGNSIQEKNEKRGKLFEKLCRDLLRSLGYEIRRVTRVNYAGMEIDIEGEKIIEKTSFIGECKAHSSEISADKLQKFVGKLTARWLKDKTMQGVFIILPQLNPYARGYYNEFFRDEKNMILSVLEEEDIIKYIVKTKISVSPDIIENIASKKYSLRLGDLELIYTEKGFFWFQYLINDQTGIPDYLCILDTNGEVITERYLIDYLQNLSNDFSDLRILSPKIESAKVLREKTEGEEIVRIRGSSSWFEYQFPASSEYFVGRQDIVDEFSNLLNAVIESKTTYRAVVINGNSGWGKSSCILKLAAEAKGDILMIPIDARTASSSRFLLYAVKYVFDEILRERFLEMKRDDFHIGGSESLFKNLEIMDELLKKDKKAVVIFFDQFENIFYQKGILEKLRNFALKLNDKQYNMVVGFSWKTDLIGITHDFPYILRDDILRISKTFQLEKFGEAETQAIIKALRKEIKAQVRKDLAFRLSEFSQGLPWLLKKLCAHIIKQRREGISQIELSNKLLNIQELFNEDINELSSPEQESLKYIAQKAPISINEISEIYSKELISSLIDKRLIVRVGPKYDIYWDIFKDYLNTGKLAAEETYILRTAPNSLLSVLKEFIGKNKLSVKGLLDKVRYTEKSIYNILKDAKLLNLINIIEDEAKPLFNIKISEEELPEEIKRLTKEKLGKHKIVSKMNELFLERDKIHVKQIASIFREIFPYIKADEKTWNTYARILGRWMDFADYGIYSGEILKKFDPNSDVKSKYPFGVRYRRPGFFIPQTQYKPIQEFMEKVSYAIRNRAQLDVSSSRMTKALRDAAGIGFIETSQNKILLTPLGSSFIDNEEKRSEIFKHSILKIEIFNNFLKIVKTSRYKSVTSLANNLDREYGNRWKDETAKGIIKILINWAKYAGFIEQRRKFENKTLWLFKDNKGGIS